MENIIYIKIKSDLVNYDLKFNHRVNIISGDSATGKSTLINLLNNRKNSKIDVNSNYKLLHLNSDFIEYMKNTNQSFSEEYVYLCDEMDITGEREILNIISKSKYKFILMIRESNLEELSYDISQIYELYQSGKYNISRPMYNIEKINNNIKIEDINSILTEDSNSGYEFYKNLNNFDVKSSEGNSNINKYLKNNQFVIVDSVGFGAYIKNFLDMSRERNIFLIYPKSFEWLLLTSEIFRITDRDIENQFKGVTNIQREKYYEKLLIFECEKRHLWYSKSKLNNIFLEDKQYTKIIHRLEELFNINLLGLNKNLARNTEESLNIYEIGFKWGE